MNRCPTVAAGCILSLLAGLMIGGLYRTGGRTSPAVTDPREQVAKAVRQMVDGGAAPPAPQGDAFTRLLVKETLIQQILTDHQLRKAAGGTKVTGAMKDVLGDGEKVRAAEADLARDPAALREMAREILVRQALEDDPVAEMAQQVLSESARPARPARPPRPAGQ